MARRRVVWGRGVKLEQSHVVVNFYYSMCNYINKIKIKDKNSSRCKTLLLAGGGFGFV